MPRAGTGDVPSNCWLKANYSVKLQRRSHNLTTLSASTTRRLHTVTTVHMSSGGCSRRVGFLTSDFCLCLSLSVCLCVCVTVSVFVCLCHCMRFCVTVCVCGITDSSFRDFLDFGHGSGSIWPFLANPA